MSVNRMPAYGKQLMEMRLAGKMIYPSPTSSRQRMSAMSKYKDSADE